MDSVKTLIQKASAMQPFKQLMHIQSIEEEIMALKLKCRMYGSIIAGLSLITPIYLQNLIATSTLRYAQQYRQSNIYTSTFVRDMTEPAFELLLILHIVRLMKSNSMCQQDGYLLQRLLGEFTGFQVAR